MWGRWEKSGGSVSFSGARAGDVFSSKVCWRVQTMHLSELKLVLALKTFEKMVII